MRVLSGLLLLASLGAGAVELGGVAPEFQARNQDGKSVKLSDYKGKPVLLYFYPKDDTPGCTKEACEFRDRFKEFKKQGAVVFGVSRQDEKSHQEFKAKHKLPFDLLVDADGKIAALYGIETMPVVGFHKRQSVLIAGSGKILQIYKDVDPQSHPKTVLEDLKKATGQ